MDNNWMKAGVIALIVIALILIIWFLTPFFEQNKEMNKCIREVKATSSVYGQELSNSDARLLCQIS